ncbi:hypothetical protein ANN_17380 [Periplaneta americana]|uniref:DUF4371 domain-containing protein n=1 Tax=Periplaneta americana TaxID=6978 RepID=A0ABQ8SST6_PERAM|nr:hypothetical protein ANN_17380 [Periplaneta americana]
MSRTKSKFKKIKLFPITVQRRNFKIVNVIESEVETTINQFVAYSLALDESTDRNNKAHLPIFIRGVNEHFTVSECLVDVIAKCNWRRTFSGTERHHRTEEVEFAMACVNSNRRGSSFIVCIVEEDLTELCYYAVRELLRVQFKVCHDSLYAVMWLVDEPREFNLPTLPQRHITYVPEKLPSKYGVFILKSTYRYVRYSVHKAQAASAQGQSYVLRKRSHRMARRRTKKLCHVEANDIKRITERERERDRDKGRRLQFALWAIEEKACFTTHGLLLCEVHTCGITVSASGRKTWWPGRESLPKEASKCGAAQSLLMELCRPLSEDLCRKVVTNVRVRLEEVVRPNGGHMEHVLH